MTGYLVVILSRRLKSTGCFSVHISATSSGKWSAIYQVVLKWCQSAWLTHTGVFCGQSGWCGHVHSWRSGMWKGNPSELRFPV